MTCLSPGLHTNISLDSKKVVRDAPENTSGAKSDRQQPSLAIGFDDRYFSLCLGVVVCVHGNVGEGNPLVDIFNFVAVEHDAC